MFAATLLQACETPATPLTALAASSLTDVLPEVAEAWKAHGATATVTFSFDSSSKLIKQIEAGAPADLLFTADTETMSHVDDLGLLAPGSRRDLLGNRLVLVVPSTATTQPPSSAADLGSVLHLALAGENVPAGTYAQAALEHAGVWTSVESKIVRGDNVRTTLGWVTRGEADAGVVYLTDARSEPAVKVAFTFPTDSHPPIVYPGAVVAASPQVDHASSFLSFCSSQEAMAIFSEHGFTPPPAAP